MVNFPIGGVEGRDWRHGAADGYAGGEGPGEPMDPNPNDIRVISATQPSDGGEGPGKTDA